VAGTRPFTLTSVTQSRSSRGPVHQTRGKEKGIKG
jgi:hypothetical protein